MMKVFDDSMKVSRSFSRIQVRRSSVNAGDTWLDGEVVTPHGIVTVTSEGSGPRAHSRLDFAHDGRLHMRTFRHRFTERGLAKKAREFAEEIAG